MSSLSLSYVNIINYAIRNDCERLISLLQDKHYDYFCIQNTHDDLWPLETALLHGSNEAANILACYLVLGKEYLLGKDPKDIKATKSIWSKCLDISIIRLKNLNKKSFRVNKDSSKYIYSKNKVPLRSPEDYHPFYYIVRDHYSKLITPFDVEHPSAFMALMVLIDDYEIESPEGHSLAGHVIMSRKMIKNHKRAILEFLELKGSFYRPLGSEELTPAIYCLKSNSVFLFEYFRMTDHSEFKSKDGKHIMHYCTNKQLARLSAAERMKIYTQLDGALSIFLIRNMKCREKERFYDYLVLDALKSLSTNHKDYHLEKFADVADKAFGTYMAQLGFKFKSLDQFKYQANINGTKQSFESDAKTSFDLIDLPAEMLELVMAYLCASDIMNIFSMTKKMQQWLKSFNNKALWKQIYRKERRLCDGDITLPNIDYKQCVINTERCNKNWRKGKFQEKILLEMGQPAIEYCSCIDDNWMFVPTCDATMYFKNMHTQETLKHRFSANSYDRQTYCVVESPPLSPPLVAKYGKSGLEYGRPGSESTIIKVDVPGLSIIVPLSHNSVAVSRRLHVIDLNTQQVIRSAGDGVYDNAKVNPFNRSMVLRSAYHPSLTFVDKDMKVVQTTQILTSHYEMIDEYNLLASVWNQGVVLFDIRKLSDPAKPHTVILPKSSDSISVDVRNQRMLARLEPYKFAAQIDLKTFQWERVWTNFQGTSIPKLYNNYLITELNAKIIGYDFS